MGYPGFKQAFAWAIVAALFGFATISNASLTGDGSGSPPRSIRTGSTLAEAVFQPAMDFDKDGCYNVPAIDAQGNVDKGLYEGASNRAKDCRDASDLDNNQVYSRARCNNGWCVIVYDYYFEKDGATTGHRYDWEHIAVWIPAAAYWKVSYVSISQHGKWETRHAKDIRFEDHHAKIVYHKDDIKTHAFRFANAGDEPPENHRRSWFRGTLLGYGGWPNTSLRNKLMSWKSFGQANIGIKDGSFESCIINTKPQHITFDAYRHDNSLLWKPEG